MSTQLVEIAGGLWVMYRIGVAPGFVAAMKRLVRMSFRRVCLAGSCIERSAIEADIYDWSAKYTRLRAEQLPSARLICRCCCSSTESLLEDMTPAR